MFEPLSCSRGCWAPHPAADRGGGWRRTHTRTRAQTICRCVSHRLETVRARVCAGGCATRTDLHRSTHRHSTPRGFGGGWKLRSSRRLQPRQGRPARGTPRQIRSAASVRSRRHPLRDQRGTGHQRPTVGEQRRRARARRRQHAATRRRARPGLARPTRTFHGLRAKRKRANLRRQALRRVRRSRSELST